MAPSEVFNITICVLGIAIFIIHIANLLFKCERRKDENILLTFFVFTAIHFGLYLAFTFTKDQLASNAYTIAAYTTFYIMNNVQVFLLFYYLLFYANVEGKLKKITSIINVSIFAIFVILDIVNIFTHIFFNADGGVYTRAKFMIISQGYQFTGFILISVITIISKNLNSREKAAFILYCLFPLISIVVQNMMPGYAIAYMMIIITTEILVLFLDVEKIIRIKEEEKKIKEAYIKIMMSQIRPHFIYNTLSSISTLITLDPNKAKVALDDFTEYLRMNLTSLTDTRLIPFEKELKHIETYVSLEKMRFNDRLTVKYDIETKDFEVPPLSIQPLVENAIKHGILQKLEGGELTIKSYEADDAYVVEVIDNGVGFDMNSDEYNSGEHIGLNNIKIRLTTMCKGELKCESKVNEGTKVVVKFFK